MCRPIGYENENKDIVADDERNENVMCGLAFYRKLKRKIGCDIVQPTE